MYSTFTDKKASIVERVQRTIRGRLFKLFTTQKDHKWLEALPKLIDSYNNSIHRSIKMRPNEVKTKHTKLLLERLYFNEKALKTERKEKYRKRLFKVGNLVRILKDKTFFSKEADQRWSNEQYEIRKVQRHNFPITYLLSNSHGINMPRSFYREELKIV